MSTNFSSQLLYFITMCSIIISITSRYTTTINNNITTFNSAYFTGMESGLMTALVLSGVSTLENIKEFSYRPSIILNGVGDIPNK